MISTVAGTGKAGFSGDGGRARQANVSPSDVAVLPHGGFLIADAHGRRIRRVSADHVITTVAGNGQRGTGGDGGAATAAPLVSPTGVAALPGGGFVIIDNADAQSLALSARLRRVGTNGIVRTIFSRKDIQISDVVPSGGGFLLSLTNGELIRLGADGKTTLIGGNKCPPGYGRIDPGDGGPVDKAYFTSYSADVTPDGAVLFADALFGRIRRISTRGVITTVAGGGGAHGPVTYRDSPCGGASPEYSQWNYFGILRVRGIAGGVSVRFATTLAARVEIVVRHGSRVATRWKQRVPAGTGTQRLVGLAAGTYRIDVVGTHGKLRQRDYQGIRVR
jgi:hypothetical protein